MKAAISWCCRRWLPRTQAYCRSRLLSVAVDKGVVADVTLCQMRRSCWSCHRLQIQSTNRRSSFDLSENRDCPQTAIGFRQATIPGTLPKGNRCTACVQLHPPPESYRYCLAEVTCHRRACRSNKLSTCHPVKSEDLVPHAQ